MMGGGPMSNEHYVMLTQGKKTMTIGQDDDGGDGLREKTSSSMSNSSDDSFIVVEPKDQTALLNVSTLMESTITIQNVSFINYFIIQIFFF
jgi:hypothetical protein